jgi:isocitrate lyase
VLDSITSLQNGADLLWIETEKPHIEQIAKMVDRIREVIPNAKLAYNNSPSFNWTLNFRWQVYDAMKEAGKDVSKYNRADLMKPEYDDTPLAIEADERIRTFRQGIACAKHQNMAGSDIGDEHKEYFAGEAALKAGGAHNTMNQFG